MYGVSRRRRTRVRRVRTPKKGQPMTTQNTERLHALDAVRGGALLLGIIVHMSMSFWPIPLWPIVNRRHGNIQRPARRRRARPILPLARRSRSRPSCSAVLGEASIGCRPFAHAESMITVEPLSARTRALASSPGPRPTTAAPHAASPTHLPQLRFAAACSST